MDDKSDAVCISAVNEPVASTTTETVRTDGADGEADGTGAEAST